MVDADLTRLAELVADEKEARALADEASARHAAIKALLAEEVLRLGLKEIVISDRKVVWHEETTTAPKLDRGALIAAGVTPTQLEKGTIPGSPKKGYLEVRVVKPN